MNVLFPSPFTPIMHFSMQNILLFEQILVSVFSPFLPLFFFTFFSISSAYAALQARPMFKDRRKFPSMADPMLNGRYPMRGLYQALAVAAMCLQEQASQRPVIADVVTALSYLAAQNFDPSTFGSR